MTACWADYSRSASVTLLMINVPHKAYYISRTVQLPVTRNFLCHCLLYFIVVFLSRKIFGKTISPNTSPQTISVNTLSHSAAYTLYICGNTYIAILVYLVDSSYGIEINEAMIITILSCHDIKDSLQTQGLDWTQLPYSLLNHTCSWSLFFRCLFLFTGKVKIDLDTL